MDAVEAAFGGAVEHFPDPGGTHGNGLPRPASPLPEGCPILALGVAGGTYWFIDELGQLRDLKIKDMGQAAIESLLQRQVHKVREWWPRYGKPGDDGKPTINGWDGQRARHALIAACAWRGVKDPLATVRGRGAWSDRDGGLVLHCGDAVFAGGEWQAPGEYDGCIYPTAAPIPRPVATQVLGEGGPAHEVERLFASWSWLRPDLSPRLMLGWLCASMLSGALEWRPMVWLTGDLGTGKSTLQKALRLLADKAIVSVTDTTAAGIWQELRMDALPVAIDELEAEADGGKVQAVINLARQAASGGVVLRGGAGHEGAKFVAQTCFLFSSILIPPLLSQDRSRIAVLELAPLTGTVAPDLTPRRLAWLGAGLRRRMVDGWPRLGARIEAWRSALAKVGHGGRGADLWGTLLGCADVALFDMDPHSDELDEWAAKLAPPTGGDEYTMLDCQRCLLRLLSTPVRLQSHQDDRLVAQWVAAAGRLTVEGAGADDVHQAQAALGRIGLKVMWLPEGGVEGAPAARYLLVASQHTGLEPLFRDTQWAARPGGPGGWVQSLRMLPATWATGAVRFAGAVSRGTAVPWAEVAPAIAPALDSRDGSGWIDPTIS